MPYENVILDIKNDIATIRINRPKALNALNTATLNDLLEAERVLHDNDLVKVVVVTGEGTRSFVAGGDIQEMRDLDPVAALRFSDKGHLALSNLEKMRKPVIAAVNGYALGGGFELALACDIIYAAEKARFGFPEVTLGVVPGFGGTQRTAKLVGLARAKDLILTGRVVTAREAYEMHLINKVVPDDQLMAEADELAKKLASLSLVAVGLAKECINNSLTLDIESGLGCEAKAFAICCGTHHKNEAMTAFLEKRTALSQGR